MFGITNLLQNVSFNLSPGSAVVVLNNLDEYSIATAVTISYIAFYTAYDKSKKTLVLQNLTDLVTLNRGLDWTLIECNKALSLAGLTTMLMSFLPAFERRSKPLLFLSMTMLWTHSAYSMYKWYGYKLSNILKDKQIKQLSIALGVTGQLILSAGYFGVISTSALVYAASVFSIAHFWTMEVRLLVDFTDLVFKPACSLCLGRTILLIMLSLK
jgi:uncharacterized membrane protein